MSPSSRTWKGLWPTDIHRLGVETISCPSGWSRPPHFLQKCMLLGDVLDKLEGDDEIEALGIKRDFECGAGHLISQVRRRVMSPGVLDGRARKINSDDRGRGVTLSKELAAVADPARDVQHTTPRHATCSEQISGHVFSVDNRITGVLGDQSLSGVFQSGPPFRSDRRFVHENPPVVRARSPIPATVRSHPAANGGDLIEDTIDERDWQRPGARDEGVPSDIPVSTARARGFYRNCMTLSIATMEASTRPHCISGRQAAPPA